MIRTSSARSSPACGCFTSSPRTWSPSPPPSRSISSRLEALAMNLQSEIEYFKELRLIDKARLLNLFLHELAEEARGTYGPGSEQVHDTAHLRFVNELLHRLTRVIEQLLAEEA